MVAVINMNGADFGQPWVNVIQIADGCPIIVNLHVIHAVEVCGGFYLEFVIPKKGKVNSNLFELFVFLSENFYGCKKTNIIKRKLKLNSDSNNFSNSK